MAKDKIMPIRMDQDLLIRLREKCGIDDIPVSTLACLFFEDYIKGVYGVAFGNLIKLPPTMSGMSRPQIEANIMEGNKNAAIGKIK